MRFGSNGRLSLRRLVCVALVMCGTAFGIVPGCGDNPEVQTTIMGALNELVVSLVDAAFLALQAAQQQDTTPVPATTQAKPQDANRGLA